MGVEIPEIRVYQLPDWPHTATPIRRTIYFEAAASRGVYRYFGVADTASDKGIGSFNLAGSSIMTGLRWRF